MTTPSQERFDEIDQELSSLGEPITSAEVLLEQVRSEVRRLDAVDAELTQLGDGSYPSTTSEPTARRAEPVEAPPTEAASGDPFTSTSGETVAADPFAAESEPPPPPPAPEIPASAADAQATASGDRAKDLDLEFPPPRPSVVPVTGMRSDVLNAELDAAIPISVEDPSEGAPEESVETPLAEATSLESPIAPSLDKPLISSAPPPIPPSRPAPRPPAPIAGARPWPPPEDEAAEAAFAQPSPPIATVEITDLDDDIEILDDDDLEMIAEPDEEEAAAASSFPPGTDPDDDAETRGFFKKLFGE